MTLKDVVRTYESRWVESRRLPFVFLKELRDDGIVTEEDYIDLRQELEVMSPGEVEGLQRELTLKERLGVALFEKIAPFFQMLALTVSDNFFRSLAFVINEGWRVFSLIMDVAADYWDKNLLPTADEAEKFPPWIRDRVATVREKKSLLGVLEIGLYQVGWALGLTFAFIPIIAADAKRALNRQYSPALPDMNTLTRYAYFNPDKTEVSYDKAAEQGFDKEEVDIFLNTARTIIGPQELRDLVLRGEISDDRLNTEMAMQGYTQERVDRLKQLFWLIPGPSDLVRFSVREAFSPEYIAQFGTLQEFPEEFAENAEKVGVSRYWAEKYWASHWELPSIQLGFEMLHRGVITDEELKGLFVAADIMPWWRDKIKEVSFNPLTRVDVRRMHKMGVLDEAAVNKAYRDVGYNEENAELMTQFTVRFNMESERDLTKSDVLGAYQRRIISQAETRTLLEDLGYDRDEAGMLISRIDFDLNKKKRTAAIKNLRKGYLNGAYALDYTQSRLMQLNLAGSEISELINLWDAEKKDDNEPLSKADLTAMYKKKIIKEDEYRLRLAGLNYTTNDIDKLVELARKGGGGT